MKLQTYEAYAGTSLVVAGKKRDGKPLMRLVVNVIVATSKADAKAIEKAHPHLMFRESCGCRKARAKR